MLKFKYFFILCLSVFFTSNAQEIIYEIDSEVRQESVSKIQMAIVHISKSEYLLAANLCEEIIDQDPTFREAYINLYISLRSKNDKHVLLLKRLAAARNIFEEDDEIVYYEGNILQAQNRYSEAINSYSDAISYSKINGEDFPIVWAYYFNRGNALIKLQKFDLAIKDYDYALKLSPDNPDILTNRGYCFLKTNQKLKACTDWNKALDLGNEGTKKYLNLYCK